MPQSLIWLRRLTLAGLVIAGAGAALFAHWYYGNITEYARHTSPDGRYQIVIYRYPRLFAMPGQGSDAPGRVALLDAAGREIRDQPIAMVQLAEIPRWSNGRVRMKLQFDWPLPAALAD